MGLVNTVGEEVAVMMEVTGGVAIVVIIHQRESTISWNGLILLYVRSGFLLRRETYPEE